MKKGFLFTAIAAVLFVVTSLTTGCKPEMKPEVYNDSVLYYYTLLDNQIADFHKAIYDNDVTVDDLNNQFKLVKDIHDKNYPLLKKIKPLKEDKWFYESVVNFYDQVNSSLENEFKQIIGYYSKTWDDSYGPKIDALDQKAVDDIIKYEDAVIDAQKKFASHYGISLQ